MGQLLMTTTINDDILATSHVIIRENIIFYHYTRKCWYKIFIKYPLYTKQKWDSGCQKLQQQTYKSERRQMPSLEDPTKP